MGNEQTKTNPLGIPDDYFKLYGMNKNKNVIVLKIREAYSQTNKFGEGYCMLYDITIYQPKNSLIIAERTGGTQYSFKCGNYLYIKNEGLRDIKQPTKEFYAQYGIEYNHEKGYFQPITDPKPKYKDEETKIEDNKCLACVSNKKCVLFENCNHIPVCFSCSEKLKGKCPLCQKESPKTRIVFG